MVYDGEDVMTNHLKMHIDLSCGDNTQYDKLIH